MVIYCFCFCLYTLYFHFQTDIDVNQVLNGDWTPLMLAASVGCKEIVEKLIDLGADINAEKGMFAYNHLTCFYL